jgi:outer membrane receptor for ferrienterochelin and colicin
MARPDLLKRPYPIRRFLAALFAVYAASAFAGGADAADLKQLSLEELMNIEVQTIYAASKYEQKVTEAPSSVSIVTSSEIKKYGYRTLADLLRSVRDFFVTNERNYSYVGVRGFGRPGDYNSRILLLIDGHRANDNIYDQAFVGTEAIIDVDLIDRVEIVRGPGSSLYGSNAFFAVVNVITKRGGDLKGTEVSGEAGSFNTTKGRLSHGNHYPNGFEAIVSGTSFDSRGQSLYFPEFNPAISRDPRATNGGISEHSDYDRSQSLFAKAAYRDFTFEGVYAERTKGLPTGAFGTNFNDPSTKTTDGHSYLDARYDHDLSAKTNLMVRAYADYYWYRANYVTGDVVNRDLSYGDWGGGEIKLSSWLFDGHRVIVGGEYTDNIRQEQRNYNIEPYSLILDDRRKSQVWASYVQDEFSLARNVIVNAGVRYDHFTTFGGTTNPRLAFIYEPTERSAIKLIYGSAFRTPNVFELYYATPGTNVSNPGLKPEKIKTYQLIYELYAGERSRISISGYYYRITDLINQVATGAGTRFENISEVTARGTGFELEHRLPNGTEGRLSYSVQRTTDKLTGEPLTNSPEQLAKLNLSTPIIAKKVFAGIEEQYMSRRRTEAGSFTRDFYVTNLTLFSRNLINRLELSASAYNLFDKQYGDPVSADLLPLDTVRQDGRSYRVKATYLF